MTAALRFCWPPSLFAAAEICVQGEIAEQSCTTSYDISFFSFITFEYFAHPVSWSVYVLVGFHVKPARPFVTSQQTPQTPLPLLRVV